MAGRESRIEQRTGVQLDFTITWKFEFNKEIAEAIEKLTEESLSLYTVREPLLDPAAPIHLDKYTRDAQLKQFAYTGEKYFNLTKKAVTYLTQEGAIEDAKKRLEPEMDFRDSMNYIDREFVRELDQGGTGNRLSVLYGMDFTGVYELRGLVIISKVVVTRDTRVHPTCTPA
jgi:hypothetical protein